MKWLPIVLVALVLAAPVSAATPLQRQVKQLQAQVKVLQRQSETVRAEVAVLKQETKQLRVNLAQAEQRLRDRVDCSAAIDSDAFHQTWRIVDVIATEVFGTPAWGTMTRIDDGGACARIGITRNLTWSGSYRFATALAFGASGGAAHA